MQWKDALVSRIVPRLCVVALLALALGGGGWLACKRWWPLAFADPGRGLPGLRVDGEAVGPEGVRGFVEDRARQLEARRVRVVVADGDAMRTVAETTLGELGVSVDVDAVTSLALRVGREGDVIARAHVADHARGGAIDVPLQPSVDWRPIVGLLVPLKEDIDLPPVPARLDLEHHGILEEKSGRYVDADGAVAELARAAADPSVVEVQVPFIDVPPRVTKESLARIDISHVMASYETFFGRGGDQGPRARNIEVASSHVDGLVIEPGQIVSFNEVVGPRSEENGFKHAHEIFKGEMVDGTGGGTCQVASTLHGAAFFGGLDVLERSPHSRPSAYIPAGLDATVVYPIVDLKLRNPFSFPVAVHATVLANKVRMELLGADKPVDVTFGRSIIATTPFGRKVVEDPNVSKPKRKQKGIDGIDLIRSRVLAYHDGRPRKIEGGRDLYPPTQEIWLIPPGYDETGLPPLGEDFPKDDQAGATPNKPVATQG
jgi:vancomycin resistance protein YoaR